MGGASLFVLTGAPGSGKTAILDGLGPGIHPVGEPAREILAEQRANRGVGTPDRDPSTFVDLLLRRSIEKHGDAQRWGGRAVFDRGVPDCVAYATLLGVDPAPCIAASVVYRYHHEVLVLEPWEEIYTVDEERTMSFAATLPFHAALMEAYGRAGYTQLEVPRASIEDRAAFVRDRILAGSGER